MTLKTSGQIHLVIFFGLFWHTILRSASVSYFMLLVDFTYQKMFNQKINPREKSESINSFFLLRFALQMEKASFNFVSLLKLLSAKYKLKHGSVRKVTNQFAKSLQRNLWFLSKKPTKNNETNEPEQDRSLKESTAYLLNSLL